MFIYDFIEIFTRSLILMHLHYIVNTRRGTIGVRVRFYLFDFNLSRHCRLLYEGKWVGNNRKLNKQFLHRGILNRRAWCIILALDSSSNIFVVVNVTAAAATVLTTALAVGDNINLSPSLLLFFGPLSIPFIFMNIFAI